MVTVTLHGGPLDGDVLEVDETAPDAGVVLPADGCSYPGGHSWYEPDAAGRWVWTGDTP